VTRRVATAHMVLVAAAALGCGTSGADRPAPDAAISDGAPNPMSTSIDAATGARVPDCLAPEGEEVQTTEVLVLELAPNPPPGVPFAFAVHTESGAPLTAVVQVCANGEPIARLHLYRGRGSVSLTLPEGDVLLQAAVGQTRAERRLTLEALPLREVGPELAAGETRWIDGEEIRVTGDVRLPVGASLTIEAGARVLFAANATLEVLGHLEVRGTSERPVLFTRAGPAAWGGIRLLPGASASMERTWLVAAGGDRARIWGHSHSQPVVWIDHAELVMRGGGTIDNPGKAFGTDGARVELDGVLVSRCDTGGEFAKSELHLKNGHAVELPDADGVVNDDDNDGIYISGAAVDASGRPIESSIEDSVFALGEDDGIDHNNGELRIARVWIEGFAHEGVAASHGNRVLVSDSVVRGNGQGIEAGYGSPMVTVDHTLLSNNQVGLRFGDDYDKSVTGALAVSASIIRGNQTEVLNYVKQLAGPAEGAIDIQCSIISDPRFDGLGGNIDVEPEGPWQNSGCADGPQLSAATCGSTIPGPRCD
jgi:Right handed beta helix region